MGLHGLRGRREHCMSDDKMAVCCYTSSLDSRKFFSTLGAADMMLVGRAHSIVVNTGLYPAHAR